MSSFFAARISRVLADPRTLLSLFAFSLALTPACGEKFVTADDNIGSTGGDAAGAGAPSTGGSSDGGTTSGGAPGTGGVPSGGSPGTGGLPVDLTVPTEGLALWLKADAGVEVTDGLVTAWRDQTANHHDATTSSLVAPKPGTATFGHTALPVIDFDGSSQYLSLPSGFSTFSGVSIFVVAVPKSLSLCESFIALSNGEEVDDITLGYLNEEAIFEVADGHVQASPEDKIVANTPVIVSGHQSGEIGIVAKNGETSSENTIFTPKNVARTKNYLGKTTYTSCQNFEGALAEVLVYTRTLDELEYETIVAYLKQRYSIN